jgi:hypothetical protein
MNRRTWLALAASVLGGVSTGCFRNGSDTAPKRSADRTPTGTCDATPPLAPTTSAGLPDARTYPERPSTLEEAAVTSFLETYEAAYRYNQLLAELAADGTCVRYLEAYATESQVDQGENAFTGTVSTRGSYTTEGCPDRTAAETATPIHADLAVETAEYRVTERHVERDDVVVACWGPSR